MKISTVCFTSRCRAQLIEEEIDTRLSGNQMLVKTSHSLISTGTELANYNALPNTGTAGDRFPFIPGYSASATVLECGPDVKNFKPGDRVVTPWRNHRSHCLINENDFQGIGSNLQFGNSDHIAPTPVHIPDAVSMADAAFTHLASFPMLAIRKLQVQMGESVMVAGLGLLGTFAVQFARLSGAYPVIACDFSAERRQLALQLGADYALDPAEPDFIEQVMTITNGRGVNCVVEVTGAFSALKQALQYVAWQGRIALLGCTRISDDTIDYYQYVHRRGISLIGCHTFCRPRMESVSGGWTEPDDYRTFLNFLAGGRVNVKAMTSQIRSPREAGEIYEMLNRPGNPLCGVLLDWNLL